MQKINFQNLPNTTTPINATNLNAIQSNVENVFNGSEVMGNIVVGSIRTKNMFDENAILRGYELIGSGTYIGGVNPNSNWYVSDFIEVQPNQNYYLTKGSSGSSNIFYNSNKEYVDIVSASSGVIAVPNNNNIKYMRFNGLLSQLSNIQFEKGSTATSYTPYQELNNHEYYTTGEQLIGTWIDGSNVYRKVITYTNSSTIGASGSVTNISIPHSTPNLSLLLNAKLIKGGYNFPTLSGGTSVNSSTSITQVTSTTINLRIINDTWGASTWYIVIEYVK